MRKLHLLSITLLAAACLPAMAQEATPTLTDAERAEIVELLQASRAETEALAAQATDEQWDLAPAPDKWSVGGVVEHLARAETAIFGLAQAALAGEAETEWQALSAGGIEPLVNNVRDRSQKFQAPELLQPTGEKDRSETLQWYAANRSITMDFILATAAPLKAHFAEGPPGKMSADRWLVLIGAHNQRHNEQIREVLEWIASGAEPMPPAEEEAAAP